MSKSKTIISGCGLSWGGQERATWVSVLRLAGADILDVGGPAVSNQWVLNRAILTMLDHTDITRIIVQLTALGKLDVEITGDRYATLVQQDQLRNFVIDNVWPSSCSVQHDSKKLWQQWLYSPGLEIQDIMAKTRLLVQVCHTRGIECVIQQGYSIPWRQYNGSTMHDIIENHDHPWYEQYTVGQRYQYHDHSNSNTVPELGWQIDMALTMSQRFWPECTKHVRRFQQAWSHKLARDSHIGL